MQVHELERPAARAPHGAGRRAAREAAGGLHARVLDLQRLAGNESVTTLLDGRERGEERSPVREVVESGGGAPLDPATRTFMEQRLGEDLSEVRVHTGAGADESARAIGAQAYTSGSDVVFRSDRYQPESADGRRVLAHELAHVVQQRSGPVAGTPAPGGLLLSDPSDPFEQAAERTAERVVAGEDVESPVPAGAPAPLQRLAVQRQGDDDAEENESQWERWNGERLIHNLDDDLKAFDDFKANPASGQTIDDIGVDASVKLFFDPLGGNQENIFHDFKGFVTSKVGDSRVAKIKELRSISNGTSGAMADDVLNGVEYQDPGHDYTMKIASEESHLLDDLKGAFSGDTVKMMKLLGTEVTVSYTNALGWSYTKKLDVAGVSYGISVDFGLDLGDAAKDSVKELLGGKEKAAELVEKLVVGNWEGGILSGLRAMLSDGWSLIKELFKFPHASWELLKEGFSKGLSEQLSPEKIKEKMREALEPGFSLFKIKMGHEGVKADKPGRYWGPEDLEGPVLGVRFLNAEIESTVGSAGYKGIDALELLGNKGWSQNLDFPQLGEPEAKLEVGLPKAKVDATLLSMSGGYATGG